MGIPQAGILEWVAMPSSRESFQPREWTQVSHIAGRFFTGELNQGGPGCICTYKYISIYFVKIIQNNNLKLAILWCYKLWSNFFNTYWVYFEKIKSEAEAKLAQKCIDTSCLHRPSNDLLLVVRQSCRFIDTPKWSQKVYQDGPQKDNL